MATSSVLKAETQCLGTCSAAAASGDRVADRMRECLALMRHLPHGLDDLANNLLDTCQVLFYIEAGLSEAIRSNRPLPPEMINALDGKMYRAQQAIQQLDNLLTKLLPEYDPGSKGPVGRMRRGWGKLFGDLSGDKIAASLAFARDDLKMNSLMFEWSLGTDKVESELGIGYLGLATALGGSPLRRKQSGLARPPDRRRLTTVSPQGSGSNSGRRQIVSQSPRPPPAAPPPPLEKGAISNSGSYSGGEHTSLDADPMSSTTGHSSLTSSIGLPPPGNDDQAVEVSSKLGSLRSKRRTTLLSPDSLAAEMTGLGLDTSRLLHLKSDPLSMPRREPRRMADEDKAQARTSLVSAVRARNHSLVERLLERGAPPNTGPDSNALVKAVLSGDQDTVSLLLLFGADPNERNKEGMSPLLAAVEKTYPELAVLLLKYGADANQSSAKPDMDSPLAAAVAAQNVNLTHLLLMYGGEANQRLADGNTLLISAIKKQTPRNLVDLLLGYGADPNGKSREGKTALFEAVQKSRVVIVSCLLEHGADPNLPGPKHMLWPAAYQPDCLQVLLSRGADHRKCPGIMELATSINSIESVRILLSAGVDPDEKKDGVYTPLCTSIRDGRSDIFRLLLKNGADPNLAASEYPAFKCVSHHRTQFLPALVEAGASLVSPRGIVEVAVSANNGEALGWLLDQNLDPNEKNDKGQTPLTSAIRDNRVTFVDLLLARGANPAVRGQDWPLCMAVRSPEILKRILPAIPGPGAFRGVMEMAVVANQLESVKLLLAAGVSVEDKNGGVFSPLTTAIRENHKEIVTFLVTEGGADVNAPGEHLPLVKALRRSQGKDLLEMVRLLLSKGADANKVYRGWNAIMQAVANGDGDVLRMLAEANGVELGARDETGRTVTEIAVSRKWDEAVGILMEFGGRTASTGRGKLAKEKDEEEKAKETEGDEKKEPTDDEDQTSTAAMALATATATRQTDGQDDAAAATKATASGDGDVQEGGVGGESGRENNGNDDNDDDEDDDGGDDDDDVKLEKAASKTSTPGDRGDSG